MSLLDKLRASNAAAGITAPPAGPREAAPAAAPESFQPPASSPAGQPSQPCSCGFRTFWQDAYGNWSCGSCRPPKLKFLARREITLGEDGRTEEISAADESRYEKFITVIGADRREHTVHRDCLDPRSDYFDPQITRKIAMGTEAADNESFFVSRYLSGVLAEKNSIDSLPGPWPEIRSEENYFSSLPDENANLPKNKKYSRGKSRGRKK